MAPRFKLLSLKIPVQVFLGGLCVCLLAGTIGFAAEEKASSEKPSAGSAVLSQAEKEKQLKEADLQRREEIRKQMEAFASSLKGIPTIPKMNATIMLPEREPGNEKETVSNP